MHPSFGLRILGLSLLLVVAAACQSSQDEAVQLTPIQDVLEGRVDEGARVTIEGAVTESTPLPLAERETYELSSEGRSITIITDQEPPQVGDRYHVTGPVRMEFAVGEVEIGTVIVERQRSAPPTPEPAGLPLWVWLAAGGAVVLIALGVLIALLARRGARREGTCPHCGAPAEADWIVCTECGGGLDEEPYKPETIISAPPEPPGPSEEELAETRRRSAPTVIIPPEDQGEDEL